MAGTVLDVEPQDFVTSSGSASAAARAIASAGSTLRSALSGSSEMAGSDPAGSKWSTQYDQVAADAVAGLDSLENALGQISAGLAVTGLNYATADWLSSGRSGHAPGYATPSLPALQCSAPPPSAAGGQVGSTIPGFHYVADFIGEMWPNGDPGKLRSARSAWNAFADRLDTVHSSDVTRISSDLDGTRTPEMQAIHSTVSRVASGVTGLATEARNLAKACGDLADQIEKVHHETEKVLIDLGEQLAATAAVGIGLTLVTAGISDAAGALAAGGEVAAAVARILSFIAELGTTVGRVVDTIATSAGSIARVAGISESITIRVVTIAGRSVQAGLGGAVSNVGVTEILDPGADIETAAEQGFIGGVAFGGMGQVAGVALKARNARAAAQAVLMDRAMPGLSPSLAKKLVVLDHPIQHVDASGKVIPTKDLVHPQANLLAVDHPSQPALSGVDAHHPSVQRLLPSTFTRWNGGPKAAYDAQYTTGALSHGQPVIDGKAWPDATLHPDGFASPQARIPVVLQKGFTFDRFGSPYGHFTSPGETMFPPRALPDYSLDAGYHQYQVLHDLPAWAGPTADAFAKKGGGPQIWTDGRIRDLLDQGYIRELVP